MDKASFAECAISAGLPIPAAAVLRSPDDASQAARTLEFRAVVKPAIKTHGAVHVHPAVQSKQGKAARGPAGGTRV